MASVIPSQLISEVSGKVGGSTFLNTPLGIQIRSSTLPVYKNTIAQQTNRQIIAALSSQWRTLSIELQEAWLNRRLKFPLTSRLGDPYYSTGLQLFLRVNFIRVKTNLAVTIDPPSPYTYPQSGILTLSLAAPNFFIQLYCNAPTTNLYWMIYASLPKSAGRSKLSTNSCRFITSLQAALSQSVNVYLDYLAAVRPPPLVPNQKIFFAAYLCADASTVRKTVSVIDAITT